MLKLLLLLLLVPSAISAALPLRWGMRFALAVGLAIVVLLTQMLVMNEPGLRNDNADLTKIALLIIIAALTGLTLRALIDCILFSRRKATSNTPLALSTADMILRLGFGFSFGCIGFAALAIELQGLQHPQALHLAVTAMAILATLLAVTLLRSPSCAIPAAIGIAVATLTLDSYLLYPDLILSKAGARASTKPYCLMLAPDMRSPTSRSDLMALTMPKGGNSPSALILMVQADTETRLYRWSFRARRFATLPLRTDVRCTPT